MTKNNVSRKTEANEYFKKTRQYNVKTMYLYGIDGSEILDITT